MTFQQFSAEIAPDTVTNVMDLISGIHEKLPFLVGLTRKERSKGAKMSRKMVDFINRSIMYAGDNPQFVPPYITPDLMVRDHDLIEALRQIMVRLGVLYEKMKDTVHVAETQLYAMARVFYKSVKAAAKEKSGDAEVIAGDLSYHYRKASSPNQEAPEKEAVHGPQGGDPRLGPE